MNGQNVPTGIGYFAIYLVEDSAGGLGSGGDGGAHGFQAVIEFIGGYVNGTDLAFWKLDI